MGKYEIQNFGGEVPNVTVPTEIVLRMWTGFNWQDHVRRWAVVLVASTANEIDLDWRK